uniref:UBA domain-containing protein n=1 Tax=Polytomella parva TaxID=51329 RepID=A0A7S0YH05_9CHLO|mmetsp:Transcript_19109/g.34572  ORF Transcript_19109/g.34572 Transcript_19109/m.34572 type:complete len:458 (+) Transcript_19109:113-1486(+)|eukprot:CAMPEP_0175046176 /NCGR_PEP_ID=MMETSP0052_2-20121109/4877_1 /TAXON_ID=51329 ORGANISM="Polytomella parva, Strain SAG 63-3" /NCGR_SAMPLE_ID=MMETSP0052_2 /ASSEMBLY_ACC=CAM_ASM_000194 /LENGTH=457 /DNA_ID=CAMNT_0016309877 /DNA_START=48 /DNA_END=1421 /DNA_ORIENTATION=-
MAKSLKCGQCGVLLRSVAEAQAHNDATGHTAFEETLELVKIMTCLVCGKPCRTDAEKDLHTKYTGHQEFVDKTNDTSVINTEQEMRAARKALREENAESDLLSSTKKKGSSSSKAADANAPDEETGSKLEANDKMEVEELEEPSVDTSILETLVEMGFSRNRAVRALHFSKATSADEAIAWIGDHESDEDLDDPLLLPKAKVLSTAETKQKAEELVRRAREKREKEEKEAERKREIERIRTGKEMQKIRAQEDDQALKKMVEQRAREKAEAAKAKEEIRLRLEEDRRERRRRLGLPEELTEEEKAAEAEKKRKEAEEIAAKKAAFISHVKPVTAISKMRDSLVAMKKGSIGNNQTANISSTAFGLACTTLMKYLDNIVRNPDDEKFRGIPLNGKAFSQRVACVEGSLEFLQTCGFKLEGEGEMATLRIAKEEINPELIRHAGSALQEALSNPFFGIL